VYKTEPELGIAIKEGGVSRDKLYVVTKVAKNIANIENALKSSLKKLQLDYVDLYASVLPIIQFCCSQSPDISSTSLSSPSPTRNSNPPGPPWKLFRKPV
jgi:diketogulonate reductase-like aldo/keto reductase